MFGSCSHSQDGPGPRNDNVAQCSQQPVARAQLPARDRKIVQASPVRNTAFRVHPELVHLSRRGKMLSFQHLFQEGAYLWRHSLQSCLWKGEDWGHPSMDCSDASTSGACKSWSVRKASLKWAQCHIARKRKEVEGEPHGNSPFLLAISWEVSSYCAGRIPAAIDSKDFNQKSISCKDCFGGWRRKQPAIYFVLLSNNGASSDGKQMKRKWIRLQNTVESGNNQSTNCHNIQANATSTSSAIIRAPALSPLYICLMTFRQWANIFLTTD